MLHGFRRFQAEGKPEDGNRSRGRETVWTPFSPRAGTGGWEAGQSGKRADFLTGNAFVATLSTWFVTILSPQAFVRVENGAFPAGFLPHNLMNESGLCNGARRGIRTPDQLCVRMSNQLNVSHLCSPKCLWMPEIAICCLPPKWHVWEPIGTKIVTICHHFRLQPQIMSGQLISS